MSTLFASYPDLHFDAVDTVPSSDEASTDSVGSPLECVDFPFMNDLQMHNFDLATLDYAAFVDCGPPDTFNYVPQAQPCYLQQTVPSYSPIVKAEPNAALQQGVLASLEALKATDPSKGYTIAKQHTTVKKIKANVSRPVVEEDRVVRRRTKNREAAQASRLRKRLRLETLEGMVAEQKSITAAIMTERDNMQRENGALRSEVEYLKEALRTSMEGLRDIEADQLFSQVQMGL
jgi:hypothetical protein